MDDETQRRRAREARNIDDLRRLMENSRTRVGVEPSELMRIAEVAMSRMGAGLGGSEPAGRRSGRSAVLD